MNALQGITRRYRPEFLRAVCLLLAAVVLDAGLFGGDAHAASFPEIDRVASPRVTTRDDDDDVQQARAAVLNNEFSNRFDFPIPAARTETVDNLLLAQLQAPRRRIKAPSLDDAVGWINTAGPVSLKDLRGKVVLLDFWTYCCINCMHMLPVLRQLEEKYPNTLVVIGVHSAKFQTEKDSNNIRKAVMRYGVRHPVANDANLALWQKYGVSVWPSFRLIDPEGYVVTGGQGEMPFSKLETAIASQIRIHRRKGTLDETPIRFQLEEFSAADTALRFPGKILADADSRKLYVADSSHNRIVVSSFGGKVLDVIGTGARGAASGSYFEATFDDPQGMALDQTTLYVADNENHMIRAVNLTAKTVRTLAGTGRQAIRVSNRVGSLRTTSLSNPWDLALVGRKLFIAMAGPHQIAVIDLSRKKIQTFSGSGREDILDGPLDKAAHAQPSGIVSDGRFLFVADSEGSAIRSVSLGSNRVVRTLVGASNLPKGASLFQFGDIDGRGAQARLQHPIGITLFGGKLYVTDTYNHKIKRIDPVLGTCETLFGDGKAGAGDDPPQFHEPAGITAADGKLFIADTNNHRIRVADLATGKVSTLELAGLQPPSPKLEPPPKLPNAVTIEVARQTVMPGKEVVFDVQVPVAEGFKLNEKAPFGYRLEAVQESGVVDRAGFGKLNRVRPPQQKFSVTVPLAGRSGDDRLKLSVVYYTCQSANAGICKIHSVTWDVPILLSSDATTGRISLSVQADAPKKQ